MTHALTRNLAALWTALRLMLMFTLILGIAYPLLVTGIGQIAFVDRANGSLVRTQGGEVVGSSLIGQRFDGSDGSPLPRYFQPRPSAAGDGYDPRSSAGSNLGPESGELVQQIEDRRRQVAEFNGVDPADVPVDAVTASGSGLDPHVSVAYARIQLPRVADARNVPIAEVSALLDRFTVGRDLGVLGEPRVNVVELNLALDGMG